MLRSWLRRRWVWASLMVAVALGAAGARAWVRQQPDPLLLLDAAAREFAQGHVDRAEELLDQRARRAESAALDWILRARIARARARDDDALRLLERVSDSEPYAGRARALAGEIALDHDRARPAERLLTQALALDPNQVGARRNLAYIFALQRRRPECDAQFRAMLALGPLDDKRAFIWCQNLCAIWDPREAGARLERFLHADPEDRASRLALAEAYLMTSQVQGASKTLEPLAEDDDDARALRARVLLQRSEESAAESLVAAGAPDHPALNLLRARLALIRGERGAAVRLYRAVLAVAPSERDALYGLGQTLRRAGDADEAAPFLDRAEQLDRLKRMIVASRGAQGSDPRLYIKLGHACAALGQTDEALTWYGLAIARDPLDTEAQAARARLKTSSKPPPDRAAPTIDGEPGPAERVRDTVPSAHAANGAEERRAGPSASVEDRVDFR